MKQILLALIVLWFAPLLPAQSASGLLGTNRYIDWSSAGAGALPARTTICATLGTAGQAPTFAQSVTAANILSALNSCTSGQTVLLNPGTYTMTTTLGPTGGAAWPSNVTLRGSGANQTILSWPSSASLNNCNGIGPTAMCVTNGDSGALQYSANVLTVSSGMTQGSTSVVLGSAPGGFSGSLSNLHVGSLVAFNQLDLTSDNGNWYFCGTSACSQQGSANAWNSPSGTYRAQTQMVTVTNISGSTVTFTPALYAPNWSNGLTPYATFSSKAPTISAGIEKLQLNTQALGDIQAMVEFMWAKNSWMDDVAFINNASPTGGNARKHVEAFSDSHITIQNSYLYGGSPSSESYGIDFGWGTADSLAQNNICQHMATCTITEDAEANVFGYNFAVDNFYTGGGSAPNWQQGDAYGHNDGDYYNLWEGHEGIMAVNDNIHGPHIAVTLFRSYFSGHDPATLCPGGGTSCGTAAKTQDTFAVFDMAYARYMNVFMNVLGTSYQNTYQNIGLNSSCPSYPSTVIYGFNFLSGNQPCTGADSLTLASSARWGNYDTVNGTVRTNSGETGSSASTYPGLASPSTSYASYPSLYLSSKPSFLNSLPWPGIGPDVTGGNISGVSGHANHNAAGTCFFGALGGVNTGASAVLNFDAYTVCAYGTGGTPQTATPTFSPGTGSYAPPVSVTISASTPSSIIYYTTDGSTPTTSSSVYSSPLSISSNTTLQAVAKAPGYLLSAVGSAVYTFATPTCLDPSQNAPFSGSYVSPPTTLPLNITWTNPTTGCVLHYTNNGSTPTCSSTSYPGGGLNISVTTVVRVIACQSGYINSSVVGGTWTINSQASAPTFSPTSPFTGGATTVTASTSTSGCSGYIYFDTSNPPLTIQTTYSFTTSVTLYAYVHGCPSYADSTVSVWNGTFASPQPPTLSGALISGLSAQ